MILRFSSIALALMLSVSALASAQATKLTYNLQAQNNSGETGTVTISPTADGKGSVVLVETKGQGNLPQPIHFHRGPCALLVAAPAIPLKTLEGGKSETTLAEVPVATLTNGQYSVNVHKSTTEGGVYVACVDIPKR
jgi:hypothetical protein